MRKPRPTAQSSVARRPTCKCLLLLECILALTLIKSLQATASLSSLLLMEAAAAALWAPPSSASRFAWASSLIGATWRSTTTTKPPSRASITTSPAWWRRGSLSLNRSALSTFKGFRKNGALLTRKSMTAARLKLLSIGPRSGTSQHSSRRLISLRKPGGGMRM